MMLLSVRKKTCQLFLLKIKLVKVKLNLFSKNLGFFSEITCKISEGIEL